MLNRTNRTLSAHRNRLNLGTRSLATSASLNNGAQTLHTRHAYPVVVRAGMVGDPVDPMDIGRIGDPVDSGLTVRIVVAHRELRDTPQGRFYRRRLLRHWPGQVV